MKNKQGFSMIEIMIVILIVALMAAYGIPYLLTSFKRSQVAEAINLMTGLKSSTEEWVSSNGTWPSDIEQQLSGKILGKYTSVINLVGAGAIVKLEDSFDNFGYSAVIKHPDITGSVNLMYNPVHKTWLCTYENMNPLYLPSICR